MEGMMGQPENPADRVSSAPYYPPTKNLLVGILNRTLGHHRHILIHRAYQLKTALIGVVGMGFLLTLMIFILYRVNAQSSRELVEVLPSLQESLEAKDRAQLLVLIGGGLVFIAGIFLVQLLESHKTAGVVHNVKRRLEELRAGRFSARVTLRKHDNFPELATTFNEAVASLRARTEGELATLSRLATQVSDLLREETQGNRAGVRTIAASLRQALEDLRRRKAELLES